MEASVDMRKRRFIRDVAVYIFLVGAFFALSYSLRAVACSRYLQCESEYGKSAAVAYLTFARQLNRTLQASNRSLDQLTPSEAEDLSRVTQAIINELGEGPRIISHRLRGSFQIGIVAGPPSYFAIGVLGVLLHRYRKLFVLPFSGHIAAVGLILDAITRGALSAGRSWAVMLPEFALWAGGFLIAEVGALFLGCVCGKGLLSVLKRHRQTHDGADVQIGSMLRLVGWRSASLAIISVTVTLCVSTAFALLADKSALGRGLAEDQLLPAVQEGAHVPAMQDLLVEGEKNLSDFEYAMAEHFRTIVDSMESCSALPMRPSE